MAVYGLPPFHAEENVREYGDRVRPLVLSRAEHVALGLRAKQTKGTQGRS